MVFVYICLIIPVSNYTSRQVVHGITMIALIPSTHLYQTPTLWRIKYGLFNLWTTRCQSRCQNDLQTCYYGYSYCNPGSIGLFVPDTILTSLTCFLYKSHSVCRGNFPCHNYMQTYSEYWYYNIGTMCTTYYLK